MTYKTTTTYRTHWADPTEPVRTSERFMPGLEPVINLAEVREHAEAVEALGDPSDASHVHYLRMLLAGHVNAHQVRSLVKELTDDVPRYRDDIRAQFVARRESRPLPPPPTPVVINLTPHDVVVAGEQTWTFPSSGIARAIEGLPAPSPGTHYIVSYITVVAARALGRTTLDLLVPGQQIRDAAGRIVGCASLQRVS